MKKGIIIMIVLAVSIIIIFGGVYDTLVTLLPKQSQETFLDYKTLVNITFLICLGIVGSMQWLGINPLDFIPRNTLEGQLRKEDVNRFKLLKSNDPAFLKSNVTAQVYKTEI